MAEDSSESADLDALRQRAEAKLARNAKQILDMSPADVRKLVHELRTHQIELEMQNEELRRAQEELVESRDKYSDLYDFAPVGYISLSVKGLILEVNLAAAEALGVETRKLGGRAFSQFIDSGSQDILHHHRNRVLATGAPHVCELQLAGADRRASHVQLRTQPVMDEAGDVTHLRTALTDITELRQATDELAKHRDHLEMLVEHRTADLKDSNQQLRREIVERKRAEEAILDEQRQLRRLLDTLERDRKVSAYEIHDGFVQPLAAAKMHFECQLRLPGEQCPPSVREGLEEGLQLLRQSLTEARRLISRQRPIVLDDFGLLTAIDNLVATAAKQGNVEIEYSCDVQFDRLAAPLETAVFRIIQEGLANAEQHGKSNRVCLTLVQEDDRVCVAIEDWGIGFDPNEAREGHFGLEGIRQRARLFGGRAVVDSVPGKGTRVTAELPVLMDSELM